MLCQYIFRESQEGRKKTESRLNEREANLDNKLDQLEQKSERLTQQEKQLDDLKADIRKNLAAQNRHRAMEQYRDDLVMELVGTSKVSAPEMPP